MNYTQAQIDRANAVSLEDFLRTQGETLIKSGREYRWKEHDSLTIRGNKWFRHSQSKGGYPIDFVMEFYGKSFPEAVQMLTGENGEGQTEATTAPPTAFHLPLHNRTADRVIQYLCESRGLNKTLVEAFLLSGDSDMDTLMEFSIQGDIFFFYDTLSDEEKETVRKCMREKYKGHIVANPKIDDFLEGLECDHGIKLKRLSVTSVIAV